ncbi:MAG: hypothetical protein JO331_14700 [Verrucomicrobia bacterium]|nr:hypothetical protein [Verrucomicrobiota bacterium]
MFKNNDIVAVREVTDPELILNDGRRMRRDGARMIKASASPHTRANAVPSTRSSCWRTALMRKAGTLACRGLEKPRMSTPAKRQLYVSR